MSRWHRFHQSDPRWRVKERVSRRFRYHVRSASNPKGRIQRECCYFHPDRLAEAHHVDYGRPFAVVWLCTSCHREAEHGTLKLPKRAIFDYTSLVANVTVTSVWRSGSTLVSPEDVPF